MSTFSRAMTVGQKLIIGRGTFFQLLDDGGAAVDVEFFRRQSSIGKDTAVNSGHKVDFDEHYDTCEITASATQTVKVLVIDSGRGGSDSIAITGTVTTAETKAATLTPVADVTVAAGATTLLSAAAATRRELIVRNLSGNTQTWRIGGATAAAATGIPLAPGESITLATNAAVHAYSPAGASDKAAVMEILD